MKIAMKILKLTHDELMVSIDDSYEETTAMVIQWWSVNILYDVHLPTSQPWWISDSDISFGRTATVSKLSEQWQQRGVAHQADREHLMLGRTHHPFLTVVMSSRRVYQGKFLPWKLLLPKIVKSPVSSNFAGSKMVGFSWYPRLEDAELSHYEPSWARSWLINIPAGEWSIFGYHPNQMIRGRGGTSADATIGTRSQVQG